MDTAEALWAVMGPTASGKSSCAMELCRMVDAEIVTVDSAQVFTGLNIGTAKPTRDEQREVRHHLLDVIEPSAQWSAAQFVAAADAAIADVRARGRTPILCGGTGLWMRALVHGIFEAPDIDPELRAEIRADLATRGAPALHAELAKVDSTAAAKIQPNDPQRIGRALEVFRQTGTPISELQARHAFRPRRYRLIGVAFEWPRDELRARISARTEAMYRDGLVAETEHCLNAGCPEDAPGLSVIGYRDAVDVVRGRLDPIEAQRRTTVATHRYAKRQRNWFNQEPEVHWIPHTEGPEDVLRRLRERGAEG